MEEIVRLQQLHIHQLQSQVDKMGKLILNKRASNTKPPTAAVAVNSTYVATSAQSDSGIEKSEGSVNASMPRRDDTISRNKVMVEAAKRVATQANDTASIPARAKEDTGASGWDSDSSGWSDTSWGASSSGGGKSPQMPKVIDMFSRRYGVSTDEGSVSD